MNARVLFLILLCVAGTQLGHARAQQIEVQHLFDLRQGFVNNKEADVFLPMLRESLTAELHFAKKICELDDRQFDEIHRAGLSAVAETANQYAELKKRRAKPGTWLDPNEAIARALQETASRILPSDVAEKYRAETNARFDANRAANVGVFVNEIDQHTQLDPDQQEQLFTLLRDNWQPHWSTGNVVFIYSRYAALPEADVLRPHLTELQMRLWAYRAQRRNVTLSWQIHFGANNTFGGARLKPFDEPESLDAKTSDAESSEEESEAK